MNILLWILQILLALHTAMGAVWKFSHSEKSVPSLRTIPHGVWLGMSVIELLCSVGLVATAASSLAILAPIAATLIAAEMLLFCGLRLKQGGGKRGELAYWLVVAALAGFIAYGRFVLLPA
ncbi:MAG TPA: hypothetical protein VHP13_10435 [Gammaproteobacteria bacterium]|nr:hypothetical protein [Gammaproteobacteria bacterium]